MARTPFRRPVDDPYYVAPWSDQLFQGDLFDDVPRGYPIPPDTTLIGEGDRRFLSGPFETGEALLLTPTCVMSAQGSDANPGTYAHPVRTLAPVVPLERLQDEGVITDSNIGNLRADRLRAYFYLPAHDARPERVALLYVPITLHHDLIAQERYAQLTGNAFRHLRVKLMAYAGGYVLDAGELGDPEPDTGRSS